MVEGVQHPEVLVGFVGDESLVVQCATHARAVGVGVSFVASASEAVRAGAEAAGLRAIAPVELVAAIAEGAPDVLFSVANEFVLPAEVLSGVRVAVNFHDGPLPEYAGLGVTSWAIANGETEHGVTWHVMTERVDQGDVLLARRFPIAADDTAFSLNARCYETAIETFPLVLDRVRDRMVGDASTAVAGEAPARFFGRYERPVVAIDPSLDAEALERGIRALDLGGRIRNRLGTARWTAVRDGQDVALLVTEAEVRPSTIATGAVGHDGAAVVLGTVAGDLAVVAATDPDGTPVDLATLDLDGWRTTVVPVAALDEQLARHETSWLRRLAEVDQHRPEHLGAAAGTSASPAWAEHELVVRGAADVPAVLGRCLAWWRRIARTATVWFEVHDDSIDATLRAHRPLLRAPVARIEVPAARTGTVADVVHQVRAELSFVTARGPFLRDLVARDPATRGRPCVPALAVTIGAAPSAELAPPVVVELVVDADRVLLRGAPSLDRDAFERAARSLGAVLGATRDDDPIAALPVWGDIDAAVVAAVGETSLDHDRTATVVSQFLDQVARTPTAPAVSAGARTLTYGELAARADALAATLAAAGVQAGGLVGIALERGTDLVAAVLATLRLGAAYVPLDPGYPADRLRFMVDDAGLQVVVGRQDVARSLLGARRAVTIVDPADLADAPPGAAPVDGSVARPEDVAYVIYTSGSTGMPKGVVLEHRNVVNFFAAMDRVVDVRPGDSWLAVTSLSFDISVLELLWTLTRGVHVVVQQQSIATTTRSADVARDVGLSLFFFAASESEAADGYRLLMESARFADREGFEAVWIPERHFHQFGGAYPNPSVIAAAVAVATDRVGIRSGSVVLPLHASARVAEEWAMVDNLSGGRVGLSVAPGWQPNDFVLNPSAYATARSSLPQRIDEVRRLWRGESVDLPGPDGAMVPTRTLPRPVQRELPVWLTSAGSPETFERAGRMGLNLLTHLLGQSVEQLGEHIALYRRAWQEAGHRGDGRVTLMLHAYLAEDGARSRALSEAPMKRYLGSAAGLIKNMASAFPTLAHAGADADEAFRSLSDGEVDELLTVAAHRYIDTSGLFGTPEDAADTITRVAALGVDEVACLIDFGVDSDDVLAALPLLAQARRLVLERRVGVADTCHDSEVGTADGVAAAVARHGVTHLQCTPSLAAMLLADPDDRAALGELRHLLVGGEAMPAKLADELRAALRGRLTNMYGPTETTIWSLVHELTAASDGPVPIGRPIANTSIQVLDDEDLPVPVGALGQLHIGGEGVARGYLGRPELTAERFVDRPGVGRTYATGDLVRLRPDCVVEFAGRVDHQVKIRGHRIELGEIESLLDRHPSIERSVVVARGAGTSMRLVAFVVGRNGGVVDPGAARHHVAAHLPAIMVPEVIVALPSLPLTPNGKIDRNALPEEAAVTAVVSDVATTPPADEWEALVAEVWVEQLARPVGRTDNFFEIGGHSLLAVAVFRRLQERTGAAIALTDVFRYPTVAAFARHLARLAGPASDGATSAAGPAVATGADRGALRRQARARGRAESGSGS